LPPNTSFTELSSPSSFTRPPQPIFPPPVSWAPPSFLFLCVSIQEGPPDHDRHLPSVLLPWCLPQLQPVLFYLYPFSCRLLFFPLRPLVGMDAFFFKQLPESSNVLRRNQTSLFLRGRRFSLLAYCVSFSSQGFQSLPTFPFFSFFFLLMV